MEQEKQKLIEEFEEFQRQEFIEKSLLHKNKDLFYKMTSPNWKEYLYATEATVNKDFKLIKPFSLTKKVEFSHFKEGDSRCYYKKPTQRIYEYDKDKQVEASSGKLFSEVLDSLNNSDSFVEKVIFVKEMLKAKDLLHPAAVSFLELLADNEDMLYNCHFIFDNEGLNGSFSVENNSLQLQEVQENFENKYKTTDVINFYLEKDYDFFFTVNEQILSEKTEASL